MIPYSRQQIDKSDIAAVVRVLRSDWLTQGPGVKAFEDTAGGVKVSMGITPTDNPLVFSGAETKEKGINTHQLLFVFHDKKTGRPFSP